MGPLRASRSEWGLPLLQAFRSELILYFLFPSLVLLKALRQIRLAPPRLPSELRWVPLQAFPSPTQFAPPCLRCPCAQCLRLCPCLRRHSVSSLVFVVHRSRSCVLASPADLRWAQLKMPPLGVFVPF